MAARYWVGGGSSTSWAATGNTNWSATSGGANNASVPTAADDVFFDAASGAGPCAIATTSNCRSVNCTGFTGTITQGASNWNIGDGTAGAGNIALKFVPGMTFSGNTSGAIINLLSTSATTQTIDTSGFTTRNLVVNGAGSSYQLSSDWIGTSGSFTLTAGTFDANGFNVTALTFASSNTNVRTLTMGSGTWTITGNNTTVWTHSTNTNLTLNAGTSTLDFTYSGSVGTRTIAMAATSRVNDVKISGGSDAINLADASINGLNTTGYTGSATFTTIDFRGSITLGAGHTMVLAANGFTYTGTSGTAVITSNGVIWNKSLTINGVGGTVQLGDNITLESTRTLTLTNGTFNANNFNVTTGLFSSSNSNVRTLTMGSGTWTLTGNAGTIWNFATTTNLTLNAGTSTIDCTYSGGTGTRTFRAASAAAFPVNNVKVSAGTDTFDFLTGSGSTAIGGDLDCTGFSGTLSGTQGLEVSGTVTYPSTMTITRTGGISFKGTSSRVWTLNPSLPHNVVIDGVGGTCTLGTSLTTTGTITVTNGTFATGNYSVTCDLFSSANSNIRTINLGSSTITLTGTGTKWNTSTATNCTLTSGTSTILISDTSATSKSFAGGGMTYNNLTMSGGTGTLTISGNNTFSALGITTAPSTILFTAGTTQTVSSITGLTGTVGNLNVLNSTSSGSTWTLAGFIPVGVDYINLKDSIASPVTLYAGANSTNSGNNTNWIFSTIPTPDYDDAMMFGTII